MNTVARCYPDLPIVEADQSICFRGSSLSKAASEARLAGKRSIIRVVGGGILGSRIESLETLLTLHRKEITRFTSTNPAEVDTPHFDWKYVTYEHVEDTLEITDAESVMPFALQYEGCFSRMLPPGLLLAAEVELIFPTSEVLDPISDNLINLSIETYHRKSLRYTLRDLHGWQFTRGVIPESVKAGHVYTDTMTLLSNREMCQPQPMIYLHDIEPRLISIMW